MEPPKSKTNPPPKYTKPQPTKKPFQQSQKPVGNNGQGQVFNECEGECVSGLFALFCDDIDSNAFCPNEGSCCMPAGSSASDKEVVATTQRITTPVIIFSSDLKSFENLFFFPPATTSEMPRFLFAQHYGCIL